MHLWFSVIFLFMLCCKIIHLSDAGLTRVLTLIAIALINYRSYLAWLVVLILNKNDT